MKTLFALLLVVALTASAAEFDVKDEAEFSKCVSKDAKVIKLADGMKFLEGPVWIPADGGYLVFSDIPNNELKKWSTKGGLETFRNPSNFANGNILDNQGRLITCEHSARRVTRTEADGKRRVLACSYNGNPLNSPNDVAVKSDGSIWFTDPPYGMAKGEFQQQPKQYVFRFDRETNELKPVVEDFDRPNGICFSPDEKRLYIADSGKPKHIRVFDVKGDKLKNGRIFCALDSGAPDGIRCDSEGRVWSSAGDGVHIFSTDGKLIGKILVPETPANLCFGGDGMKTLFITARTSLYSIPVNVVGK